MVEQPKVDMSLGRFIHFLVKQKNGMEQIGQITNVDAGSAGRRSDAGGCYPSQIYLIGGYGSNGQDYFTTFDGSILLLK